MCGDDKHSMGGNTGRSHAGVMLWMVSCSPEKSSQYWKTATRKVQAV